MGRRLLFTGFRCIWSKVVFFYSKCLVLVGWLAGMVKIIVSCIFVPSVCKRVEGDVGSGEYRQACFLVVYCL